MSAGGEGDGVVSAGWELELVIRPARPGDTAAIAHLAELDESPVPPPPLLVAEVGGTVWAAVSVHTLQTVADPFRPSGEVVALAVQRARHLCPGDAPDHGVGWRILQQIAAKFDASRPGRARITPPGA